MTTGAHTDLASAAARGDDAALAALVKAYHDRVYRFGLRVCRDGYDADDAVQEAFTRLAWRPDVQRDPSALSWLMSVVRNACLRLLRPLRRERQKLTPLLELPEEPTSPTLDPEHALERWQLVRAVHAAIAELEPAYREVLILRDLEGLSGEEASRALGLELSTTKTRLLRARASLRESLESGNFAPAR